jgi:hypothetical protein
MKEVAATRAASQLRGISAMRAQSYPRAVDAAAAALPDPNTLAIQVHTMQWQGPIA